MTSHPGDPSPETAEKTAEHIELLKEIEVKIDGLKEIEGRLGTTKEVAGDIERVRELAHRVNNLLTTFRLPTDFRVGDSNA